MDTNSRE